MQRIGLGLGGDMSAEDLVSALNQYQLNPQQVASGVAAYTGLSQSTVSATLNLAKHGIPTSFTAAAPILAAALAATGVGAPAAAIVAAALPVLDALVHLFFGGSGSDCVVSGNTWKLGDVCYRVKAKASWPGSPNWMKFHETDDYTINHSFPEYFQFIRCPLAAIEGKQLANTFTGDPNNPVDEFLKSYYRAWEYAAEFAMNGYNPPNPIELLKSVKESWDRGHSPSSKYTFKRKTTIDGSGPTCSEHCTEPGFTSATCTYDSNKKYRIPECCGYDVANNLDAYVALLLGGQMQGIDGSTISDYPDIDINVGPEITPGEISTIPTSELLQRIKASINNSTGAAPAGMSTAGKVAVSTLAVVGAAAAGSAIYAFATKQSVKYLWKKWYHLARGK